MPLQVSDIMAGPAKLYVAPLGSTLPADTLAADAAWPSGWVRLGYTKEPLKAAYEWETLKYMIQEALSSVKNRVTEETMKFETTLAELTGDTFTYTWDGSLSTTAQYEKVTFGGQPLRTERMWGFEGKYVDEDGATFPIRLIIYKGTAMAGGELEFGREDYTGLPFTVEAIADLTKSAGNQLFYIIKIIEP